MKYALFLATLSLAPALAQAPATILIPREKVSFTCTDTYFKSQRENFLLLDETYPTCTLKMPLALRQRWPGVRTFYVIPRVSASLHSKNNKGEGKWQPLTPLVNPGPDPMHRALSSRGYEAIELTGKLGKLSDTAGQNTPDTVSTGGKITVCVAPVYQGEDACKTFDVAARFKVYTR
ncbi:hypothetical protein [Deinococcus fonticola]|uniref:hypothetical protein n=1 Tax=Deinococcus fonticola TaxID=2528713 RepID=UPI0010750199|nr:hypothetical protein [Deinococcus fonticola]